MQYNYPSKLFEFLAKFNEHHSRGSIYYEAVRELLERVFEPATRDTAHQFNVSLAEVGLIQFPYEKMGAIDSFDLFGLDELIIFSYYYANKNRYKKVVDIGANLGLHSILMSRCFSEVISYEPDPNHMEKLSRNILVNRVANCKVVGSAVSDKAGKMPFIRVLGNTTSSHLKGAKKNPYGELEEIEVGVVDVLSVLKGVDFMKIDAEGHEAVILTAIPISSWNTLDIVVEIGSPENSRIIFDHFALNGINLFPQKLGWKSAKCLQDLPSNYKEGSVFISKKSSMPW